MRFRQRGRRNSSRRLVQAEEELIHAFQDCSLSFSTVSKYGFSSLEEGERVVRIRRHDPVQYKTSIRSNEYNCIYDKGLNRSGHERSRNNYSKIDGYSDHASCSSSKRNSSSKCSSESSKTLVLFQDSVKTSDSVKAKMKVHSENDILTFQDVQNVLKSSARQLVLQSDLLAVSDLMQISTPKTDSRRPHNVTKDKLQTKIKQIYRRGKNMIAISTFGSSDIYSYKKKKIQVFEDLHELILSLPKKSAKEVLYDL